ncbi:MAG: NTP transferase domain-containing protein [Oscillospiraceae bacterium]|jgi:bifunctional UDP-N-acetylglucosamine pyrophosphorylase/glucosamine-1-phosphate N-acetyltransferase/UDP-N-acetylglucosamine pyrophosphorylase|nr:NTP transferase domain-containing protein [Oscillospiraceae bacterium]
MNNRKAIVLAAGKGTRMFSEGNALPKVMRPALGRPMIGYVLDALSFLPKADTVLVVGYRQALVRQALGDAYPYAEQLEQRGTGHAVQCAAPLLTGFDGPVLICYGDMPLVRRATYERLFDVHARAGHACTLLSGVSNRALPYGRVLRDADGGFDRVVEDADCTPAQKAVPELNAGVYVMESAALFPALAQLRPNNAQGELYLTDVPALFKRQGLSVGVCASEIPDEILGVNTPEQLAQVEECLSAGQRLG